MVQSGALDVANQYDTEALVSSSQTDVERAANQIGILSRRIAYYLGWNVTNNVQYTINVTNFNRIIGRREQQKVNEITKELNKNSLYQDAIVNRKDFQQAKINYRIKSIQKSIEYGYLMPLLNVNLNFSTEGRDEDLEKAYQEIEWSDFSKWNWRIGFDFSMPINPFSLATVVERASVENQKAHTVLKRMEKEIALDVEEKINNVHLNYNKLVRNRDIYGKMRRKKNIYRKDFQSGKIDLNTLIRANDDQRHWQQLYSASVYDYRLSLAQLEIAKGTMLEKHQLSDVEVK